MTSSLPLARLGPPIPAHAARETGGSALDPSLSGSGCAVADHHLEAGRPGGEPPAKRTETFGLRSARAPVPSRPQAAWERERALDDIEGEDEP